MRPGGAFYQFTYGPRCPVPRPILDRLGLKATRIGGTVRNIPPAGVYRISRSTAARDLDRSLQISWQQSGCRISRRYAAEPARPIWDGLKASASNGSNDGGPET